MAIIHKEWKRQEFEADTVAFSMVYSEAHYQAPKDGVQELGLILISKGIES